MGRGMIDVGVGVETEIEPVTDASDFEIVPGVEDGLAAGCLDEIANAVHQFGWMKRSKDAGVIDSAGDEKTGIKGSQAGHMAEESGLGLPGFELFW